MVCLEKKIEAGIRRPGIQTYRRMMAALETDIVIRSNAETIKGDCTAKAQQVFLESTGSQAELLVQVLEFMAQNLKEIK